MPLEKRLWSTHPTVIPAQAGLHPAKPQRNDLRMVVWVPTLVGISPRTTKGKTHLLFILALKIRQHSNIGEPQLRH